MKTIVLGAGIVGTATAYFLAKQGHEVEVVERQSGAALETSFGNGGVIHAREVHGEDGLGGAPRPEAIAEIAGSDAAGFLVSELSIAATSGQKIDLLFIGPLTNLAMALVAAHGLTNTSPDGLASRHQPSSRLTIRV